MKKLILAAAVLGLFAATPALANPDTPQNVAAVHGVKEAKIQITWDEVACPHPGFTDEHEAELLAAGFSQEQIDLLEVLFTGRMSAGAAEGGFTPEEIVALQLIGFELDMILVLDFLRGPLS